MDELVCSVAAAPIDALRLRAGLDADDGAALHSERVFTSFPQSLDGEQSSDTAPAPFRIRPIQTTSSTTSAGWRPTSPDLPLVYITFGTVLTTVAETQELYRTAVAAVAELPVEALLTTGKGFDRAALGEIPPNVLVEAFVPQAEVFPHASVMVCHGGSGTTLGGLAAGIPLVVVPHTADQPANAKRVATMGAGLALEKPDIATLRAAIQKILGDASFRDTARAVSREMAQLPDVSDAVVAMLALATSESAKSPRAR
jgi:MGT family glycosyltransferase